jgi:hypothetical protein
MANEQQVRKIALFFFFTLLDEKIAFEAAHKAVSALKAKWPMRISTGVNTGVNTSKSVLPDAAIIVALKRTFEQFKKSVSRNPVLGDFDSMIEMPRGSELAAWRAFQRTSPENEIIAVVLSKILHFEDKAVAKGLNISLGTARYRIGKGIRSLGEIVIKNE